MQNLKNYFEPLNNTKTLGPIDYLSIGVGCHCLMAIYSAGLFDALVEGRKISHSKLSIYGKETVLRAALITLEKSGVVSCKEGEFTITDLGKEIAKYIGLFTVFFDGYAGLIAQECSAATGGAVDSATVFRGSQISKASVAISQKMIDPLLIQEILDLGVRGTICDLGCGYASMLSTICQNTGNPGLGFDQEATVIAETKNRLEGTDITVEVGDIFHLEGVWEDVVMLMQCHVLHDVTPNERCASVLNSYLKNFPNLKCFFYIDTVAPSTTKNEILPGFDYVHGLLNIPTRNYEETMEMFRTSAYQIMKEIPLEIPNTFIWILVPRE